MVTVFDKCYGSIFGLACGDALGVPVETMSASEIRERYGYVRGLIPSPPDHRFPEVRNLPAGTTSDDTQLARAIMQAIIKKNGIFDVDAIAAEHVLELDRSTGRGWGSSTRSACRRLKKGVRRSKSAEPSGGGNGVIMKIAPLGLMSALKEGSRALLFRRAEEVGRMTHGDPAAVVAGIVHALLIKELAQHDYRGIDRQSLLNGISVQIEDDAWIAEQELGDRDNKISRMWASVLELDKQLTADAPLEEVAKLFNTNSDRAFYSVDSFGLSYFLFIRKPFSFDAVFDAVDVGGDTDTNAAVVGSLVGALNGTRVIPENILSGIEDLDGIEAQTTRFIKKVLSKT